MHYNTQSIIVIIIVEFTLVALIVFLTIILKLSSHLAIKKKVIITNNIEAYIGQCIASEKNIRINKFPNKWKRIDILLPIINKLNKLPPNSFWYKLRTEFVESLVLPLARQTAYSKNWLERFFAAEAFGLMSSKKDEKTIIDLVSDEIPLVFLNAVVAAVYYCSTESINAVITRMAKERRFSQDIFIQNFNNASSQLQSIVEARLEKETDPYVRATCYKILSKCPLLSDWPSSYIEKDLRSSILELKLSVIRFIIYAQKNKAIPTLVKELSSKLWQVRVVALHALGDLEAVNALSNIAYCLQDKKWWVRLTAAQTLKRLGDEGIKILKKQDPQVDRYAFEAAQYVLDL